MGKTSNQVLELQVEGMSCENCAGKVESAIMALKDINETHINLESKKVEIKGNDIDFEEVKSAIEKSGYRVTEGI